MKQIFKLLCAISIFATTSLNANNDKPFVLHDSNAKAYEMKLLKNGLDFGEYKGKVVLMVFFGKMCPPCLMEIPHLVELQKKLKDKLQILAIHVQSPMSDTQMNDFIKRFGINYRVFKNDAGAGEFIDFIMYNLTGEDRFLLWLYLTVTEMLKTHILVCKERIS